MCGRQRKTDARVLWEDETHLQSLDFYPYIKPLEHRKWMHAHCHQGSCPNRQPASPAKWQTCCWVHFHQTGALISLPSLLFISCFVSSLSRAFEIFPLWWSLSFHLHWRRRVGRLKEGANSCTYCCTHLSHLPSIHLLNPSQLHLSYPLSLYDLTPPSSVHVLASSPFQSFTCSQILLLSRRKDLQWVTDSWIRIHEVTSGSLCWGQLSSLTIPSPNFKWR